MDEIIIKSPSKINLGINVVRKRNDGFHDIETVFYPLLLSDIISIKKSDKNIFTTKSTKLNREKNNLILQAKSVLEDRLNREFVVEIELEKNIPIGGGLGGGSSNAASTLIALNKLFNLELKFTQLSEITLELGSDVPFFLNPVPSFAESRGELLSPVSISINYPILIVNPGINISTRWAFSKILPKNPTVKLAKIFNSTKIDFNSLTENVLNDFEEIVFKEYTVIKDIKSKLYELGAEFALMTGTGSSVFGIFNNLQKAFFAQEVFKNNCFTYLNNPFTESAFT